MELVLLHSQRILVFSILVFSIHIIQLGCFKKSDHVDTVNTLCIDVGSPPIVEDCCHYYHYKYKKHFQKMM